MAKNLASLTADSICTALSNLRAGEERAAGANYQQDSVPTEGHGSRADESFDSEGEESENPKDREEGDVDIHRRERRRPQ